MARIRTIKPEFWQDEKLGPLDPLTRLVFLGLVSQADDAGRLLDSPRLINGMLFPYTDDDCTGPLEQLAAVGVILRGTTASGQPVIQICGWSKHQRIEKPNLAAALPSLGDESPKRRRRVGDDVRRTQIEQAEARCDRCGVEMQLTEADRAHRASNQGGIDGSNPGESRGSGVAEPLVALCLDCERGDRVGAPSPTPPRNVADESATDRRPDLRSTIYDQRPTSVAAARVRARDGGGGGAGSASSVPGWDAWLAEVPDDFRPAVDGALRSARDPVERQRLLLQLTAPITGGTAYPPPVVAQALQELAVAGSHLTAAALRGFCRRLVGDAERERLAAAVGPTADAELYRDA